MHLRACEDLEDFRRRHSFVSFIVSQLAGSARGRRVTEIDGLTRVATEAAVFQIAVTRIERIGRSSVMGSADPWKSGIVCSRQASLSASFRASVASSAAMRTEVPQSLSRDLVRMRRVARLGQPIAAELERCHQSDRGFWIVHLMLMVRLVSCPFWRRGF